MTFNPKNMENPIETSNYEKPSLKRYGTMKELTFSQAGSGSDAMGTLGSLDVNFPINRENNPQANPTTIIRENGFPRNTTRD